MRHNLVRMVGAAFVAALSLVGSPHAQTTHTVDLESFTFVPSSLTVQVGDTVDWVWVVGLHNVISGVVIGGSGVPDGNFSSGAAVPPPATYSITFDQAFLDANPVAGNNYDYYCEVHAGIGMTGNIQVLGAVPAPALPIWALTTVAGGIVAVGGWVLRRRRQ